MVAGIPGASGLVAWNAFIKDPETQLSNFRKSPNIQRQIDKFTEKFTEFETLDDLVNDREAMYVVLSAFQLEEEINYTARNKKIIEEPYQGEGAEGSLVNILIDQRYRDMAETFGYAGRGDLVFASTPVMNEIIDRFVINEFEKSLGESNPGLREAAYFSRSVGDFTSTVQLLSSKALRAVIDTGLGLPAQFAQADLDQQIRVIENRLDVEDFFTEDSEGTQEAFLYNDAKANIANLSPGQQAGKSALTSIETIIEQLRSIQGQFTSITDATDPLGPNAAEITFQENNIGELITAGGAIEAAQKASQEATDLIAEMRKLYFDTKDLNPVADAAEIAANQERFGEIAGEIGAVLAGASIIDPETGVETNLLLPIPGPGPSTVTYQLESTSAAVNVTGYDLSGFLADIQTAATDFQAGNYVAANNLVVATRTSLYTARNDLIDVNDTYQADIDSVEYFSTALDMTAITAARVDAQQSLSDAGRAVNILTQLEDLAKQLSDPALTAPERAALETLFSDQQVALDAILNPPAPNNYLTNGGATLALNGFSTYTTRGIDFNNGALYPDIDPARIPADAADAAGLATTLEAIRHDMMTLERQLQTDTDQLNMLETRSDPFGKPNAELQALTDQLEELKAAAQTEIGADEDGNGGRNLLAEGTTDLRVYTTSGESFVMRGADTYGLLVEDFITAANSLASTDRAGTDLAIDTALNNALSFRDQFKTDLRHITAKLNELNLIAQDNAPETDPTETSDFANPYKDANAFTLQFIQRYLALNDQATQSANNPYLLLFGGGAGGDDSGGASGIVNLLI